MLLEFREVKKSFNKKQVLSGINFGLHEGEIFGLIGPSGGGKTTLLKILNGILIPDSGKVFFNSRNIFKNLRKFRMKIGFSSQENTLFDELTIQENAFYFSRLYQVPRKYFKNRFFDLISLLGLQGFENTSINQLSGGMKKRANLLVSLIHKPHLLILDEPTAGLDSLLRNSLWEYIKKINKEDKVTVLVVSHLLGEIEENCKRISIMKDGQIFAVASMKQYKEKYGKNISLEKLFEAIFEK